MTWKFSVAAPACRGQQSLASALRLEYVLRLQEDDTMKVMPLIGVQNIEQLEFTVEKRQVAFLHMTSFFHLRRLLRIRRIQLDKLWEKH